MKKAISILLVTLCTFLLCATAFATSVTTYYEETDYVSQSEESSDIYFSELNNAENAVYSSLDGAIRVNSMSPNTSSIENWTDLSMTQFSQHGSGMITGALNYAGDFALYTLTVDHSVTPKVLVCAYPFATTKDFAVQIYGEDSRTIVDSKVEVNKNYYDAKKFYSISSSNGQTETYTILITALEDSTGFGLAVGTEENFAEDFGGLQTCPTVPKNIPYGELEQIGGTRYFCGYPSLLGVGEYFLYIADGETFIQVGSSAGVDIDFSIQDLDTGLTESSQPSDHMHWYYSDTYYDEVVARRLDLEAGHTYLIKFYSNSYRSNDGMSDHYLVWIGLPTLRGQEIDCTSTPISLPANTQKTYTFNLSGFPKSARVSSGTRFHVKGSNSFGVITYCQITAPNGYSFLAPYGQKSGLSDPVLYNYLKTPGNIPVNGKWTVTVTSSKAIPDLKFSISGFYKMIPGSDVN